MGTFKTKHEFGSPRISLPRTPDGSPSLTGGRSASKELRRCEEITSINSAELKCGWGNNCKPEPMQKLNSPKWFLFFLVTFSMAQGMIVNGFTNVGLSTLEKQFKLTSKQSGMIVAAKEISSLALIAFLSYYGSFGHKPRYLGVGAILTAVGSLLYVLPHVLVGKYIPDGDFKVVKDRDHCIDGQNANSTLVEGARCVILGHSEWYYMFIFIIAKLLLGAGTAPLFTLGAAYIDENVKPKVAPIYIGVWYAATFFGPGIGFVAGGSLLNIYVDLIQPEGMNLSPDDPRWIGAWWLGHFFGGLLILLTSCALFAYPRYMPGARAIRAQAIRDGTVRPEDSRIHGKLKEMLPATFTLLKNATYVFNTLALSCSAVIATGLGPFIVKYMMSQFGASTSKAGIASGITLIPGTAGGIFLGSILMKRLNRKGIDTCKVAAKYCFIFQVLAVGSVATFLIPGCKPPSIVGVHRPYYDSALTTHSINLTSHCNSACFCDAIQYSPVCGVDDRSYFAPCQAGCKRKLSETEYGDCSCIDPNINKTYPLSSEKNGRRNPLVGVKVVKGLCDRDCKNMIPFLVGALAILLLNFINAIPSKMVVMRCVPDNERAYALGLQWIFFCLLGTMPGPVLFGIFIDKSCDLWEKTCTGVGNCLEYNNVNLSYMLAGATSLFQVLAAIFYFLSWRFYKPPPKTDLTMDILENGKEDLNDNNSLTTSNLTEGTTLDDAADSVSTAITGSGLVSAAHPFVVKESSI